MSESQGYLERFRKAFVPVTSKEQWEAIEDQLKYYFSRFRFRIGETLIDVERRSVKEGRSELVVFIDGKIEMSKMLKDQETGSHDQMVMLVWRRCERLLVSRQKQNQMLSKWKAARVSKKEIENLKKIAGFDRSYVAPEGQAFYLLMETAAKDLVKK